jgi:hypothetical protein
VCFSLNVRDQVSHPKEGNKHSGRINNFFLICIVRGGIKVHWTLRPLNGLLCQPRVIMIMEKSVERLVGETEVLGENLPQCRFVHHKPHMLPVHWDRGFEFHSRRECLPAFILCLCCPV